MKPYAGHDDNNDPTGYIRIEAQSLEYTPTTEEVANAYAENRLWLNANIHLAKGRVLSEFDRWLAEHDRQVLIDYEMRRKPDPIHIDSIDGKNSGVWLAEHDREQREIAWDEGFLAGEEYLVERAKGNFRRAGVFNENPHRKG